MYLLFPETVKVLEGNIVKIVWIPPEYGDAVACISADGIVSLWEEVAEGIITLFFQLKLKNTLLIINTLSLELRSRVVRWLLKCWK